MIYQKRWSESINNKCSSVYLFIFMLSMLSACSLFEDTKKNKNICQGGDCWVKLYTDFEVDANGYHRVKPQWSSAMSGRFNIYIESSPTVEECQGAGNVITSSSFDSNAYWEVESGLSFIVGLYNPFQGLVTQDGNPIKVKDTVLTLNQFKGTIVPIVQNTSVYHDVKDKMACYGWNNQKSGPTPIRTGNCVMYSQRIVGPLIQDMIGDTITIYSNTDFHCRSFSLLDSIKVIIE